MGNGDRIGESFGNVDASDENTILADYWLDFVVAREGDLMVKQSPAPGRELDNRVQDFSKGVESLPDDQLLIQAEVGILDRDNDFHCREESAATSAGMPYQEPVDRSDTAPPPTRSTKQP